MTIVISAPEVGLVGHLVWLLLCAACWLVIGWFAFVLVGGGLIMLFCPEPEPKPRTPPAPDLEQARKDFYDKEKMW